MQFFKKSADKHPAANRTSGTESRLIEFLPDKDFSVLREAGSLRKYSVDDPIINEGDTGRSFFIVMAGRVKILKRVDGHQVEVGLIGKGDLLGEIAFIREAPRTTSAVAELPSKLLEISFDAFASLPERVQICLYKHLAALAMSRGEKLLARNVEVSQREKLLSGFIRESEGLNGDPLSSPLIQGLIAKIPKLPIYAGELAGRLMDEKTSPQEVVELIKKDPSLMSQILKSVNSAYFGLTEEVSDFSRAVLLMGFNHVYQIAMNEGMKKVLPDTDEFSKLRERSFIYSMIGYEISMMSVKQKAGINSTIGLLSNVGESVIILLKKNNPKIAELVDLLDQGRLGGALFKSWELPERISTVVEYQRYPEFSPPDKLPENYAEELAVLYVARVCYMYLIEKQDCNFCTAYFKDYMAVLGFPRLDHIRFCEDRILGALMKNEKRLPADVREILQEKTDS